MKSNIGRLVTRLKKVVGFVVSENHWSYTFISLIRGREMRVTKEEIDSSKGFWELL